MPARIYGLRYLGRLREPAVKVDFKIPAGAACAARRQSPSSGERKGFKLEGLKQEIS
jgi:hypothetical protein